MEECNLATNTKGPTFVNVSGINVSEIDYFLFNKTKAYTSKRIIDVPTNVSDHHPVKIEIECSLKRNANTNDKLRQSRIRWEKLDKTGYEHLVTKNIKEFENELDNHTPNIHTIVQGTTSVLVNAAKKNSKQRTYGKNVLKLKFWNQDISDALLKANKTAYKEWKEANRPMDIDNPLLQKKKTTRKIFRNSLRNEDLRRKHETRNDLINSNRSDKQMFHKLVRKQRQKGNIFINDLNVGDIKYDRDNIINGWFEHFKNVATPQENSRFSYQHLDLCELDYNTIKCICNQYQSRSVTMQEMKMQ